MLEDEKFLHQMVSTGFLKKPTVQIFIAKLQPLAWVHLPFATILSRNHNAKLNFVFLYSLNSV